MRLPLRPFSAHAASPLVNDNENNEERYYRNLLKSKTMARDYGLYPVPGGLARNLAQVPASRTSILPVTGRREKGGAQLLEAVDGFPLVGYGCVDLRCLAVEVIRDGALLTRGRWRGHRALQVTNVDAPMDAPSARCWSGANTARDFTSGGRDRESAAFASVHRGLFRKPWYAKALSRLGPQV